MKDLDRLSPASRVQDKTSSVAPVLNLHTEFVVKIAAVDHLLHLQLLRLIGIPSRCVKRRAVSLPPAALQG
jgi:hypothetical protein